MILRRCREQPVDGRLSLFDRFATYTSERVSKAWFFGVCAVLVLIWVPTFWLWPSIDGWALVINTFTLHYHAFLLVALLQETETRAENATQRKLNAISDALAGSDGRTGRRQSGSAPVAPGTDRSGWGRTQGKHEVRTRRAGKNPRQGSWGVNVTTFGWSAACSSRTHSC